jgi:hypothetical protein
MGKIMRLGRKVRQSTNNAEATRNFPTCRCKTLAVASPPNAGFEQEEKRKRRNDLEAKPYRLRSRIGQKSHAAGGNLVDSSRQLAAAFFKGTRPLQRIL